jgi:hypothetical protein
MTLFQERLDLLAKQKRLGSQMREVDLQLAEFGYIGVATAFVGAGFEEDVSEVEKWEEEQ